MTTESGSPPAANEGREGAGRLGHPVWVLGAALIFIAGCFIRFHVWHTFEYTGFDEQVYCAYLDQLNASGLSAGPQIFRDYAGGLETSQHSFLPPTRLGYLAPALAVEKVTGLSSRSALRLVSVFASCVFMAAGCYFCRRWFDRRSALAVLALLAFAPLQIHLTQYAFVDSVCGAAAVLAGACLWESMTNPRWLVAFALSFFYLCLTKQEIALVVSIFIVAILLAARVLGLGKIDARHWGAFAGSLASAIIVLAIFCGGPALLLHTAIIYPQLTATLPYNLANNDGPWHRYLIEHLFVNPAPFLLALSFVVMEAWRTPLHKYWLLFVGVTYLILGNVPHSMSLRQTVMWDLPIAIFAVQALEQLTKRSRFARPAFAAAVILICLSEFWQFNSIFRPIYETDPTSMFQAVHLIR